MAVASESERTLTFIRSISVLANRVLVAGVITYLTFVNVHTSLSFSCEAFIAFAHVFTIRNITLTTGPAFVFNFGIAF